jgi:hypothetical protein
MKDDLYIGYLDRMPGSIRRVIKPTVAGLLLVGLFLATVFALGQGKFAKSVFEFGTVKEFEGSILAKPVPFLLIERKKTGDNTGLPLFDRYPLVGEGKFGVAEEAKKLDGKRVRVSGTLILRDGLRMIEVVTGGMKEAQVEKTDGAEITGIDDTESLGQKTLRGEIIDSKCYLGVMNPGNTKVHRDCAVACLRGGVPALFVVKDDSGNKSELWLLSKTGESVSLPDV